MKETWVICVCTFYSRSYKIEIIVLKCRLFQYSLFEFSHHQRKWLVSLMMQEVNCKKAKKNGKFLLTFFSKKNHTKNHLFVQENFLLPYLFEKESVKNFDNIFLNNSTNDCPSTIWSCFLVSVSYQKVFSSILSKSIFVHNFLSATSQTFIFPQPIFQMLVFLL